MSSKDNKYTEDFKFHVPVELVKSDKDGEETEWRIKGIASTSDKDLQGEEVIQEGLDISTLKEGKGLFNNDHLKGPENILGEIEKAGFVDHNGKRALMVEGYLFKNQERAKAYYNIMTSIKKGRAPRVHFSIEGKIEDRDMTNTHRIRKARVNRVALTLDPVNPNTFASLAKSLSAGIEEVNLNNEILDYFKVSLEKAVNDKMNPKTENESFKEELTKAIEDLVQKAISAGAGYSKAPGARTGGEATSTESLDKKKKKTDKKELIDYITKSVEKLLP